MAQPPQAKTILGIIPARGGSKGVVRKNMRDVGGRPLIAYTIDAAQHSACLTRIAVSTDDAEIAGVAATMNCPVLLRPAELAQDDTPMVPVVLHALAGVEKESGLRFDYVMVLQPTAPLRHAEDIDAAARILEETGADSVVSVVRVRDHHPARMYRVENDRLIPYAVESSGRLRQELPPVYLRNGAIYACRRRLLDEGGGLIGPDTRPYEMPSERSINIDEELDLIVADVLLRREGR